MKKFRLMIMSLLMLALGGMLVACTTRSPNVEFTSNEEVMSVGQQIDLSEYLKVSGKIDDVDLNVENSSVVSIEGKILKAKSTGKTYVYATYKKNVLASLHIVVKDSFTAPTGFNIQEDRTLSGEGNVLTWNTVSAFYQNEPNPTVASQYLVKGTLRKVSEVDGSVSDVEEINQVVNTNRFVPQEYGEYTLTVTALGKDYFDASVESEFASFYYGAMPQVLRTALTWNTNGTLSWEAVDGASYRVVFDGMTLGARQTETSYNLSTYFDETYSGEHEVGIVVYDNANKKLPTVSQMISIIKIDYPTIEYHYDAEDGGEVLLTAPDFASKLHARLSYDDASFVDKEYNWDDNSIVETFVGVPAGAFHLIVYADPIEGNYYKSDRMISDMFYKLSTLGLAGTGENEENQTTWELVASAHTIYQTKILTNLSGVESAFDGLNINTQSKTIQLNLNESGNYVLTAKQIPNAEQYVYRELPIYAINSDNSNSVTITKLAQIENIAHAYVGDASVFSYEAVDGATRYELFVLDGEEYVAVPSANYDIVLGDTVTITFAGKVETLFDAYKDEGTLTFKIVAHTANDLMTINSATEKVLTELAAPERVGRQTTEVDYTWTEVEFADEYNIEVYKIDKTTFDAGSTDIDTSSLTNLGQTVDTNLFTFEEEGYYFVKVFSISGSENTYISSTTYLADLVCVAKRLQVEDVRLGYNGEKYYLNIKNSANVDTFGISVDNVAFENVVSDQTTSTYILTQNFDENVGEHEITVVAHATDSAIYLDSETYTLTVIKLPAVTKNNLTLDEWSIVANSDYVVTNKAQDVSLSVVENAKGVKIWETLNEANCAGGTTAQSARYSLADKTNVSLSFIYYGSAKTGEYFNIENDTVCLNSEVSEIAFERLSTLTELRYDSGSLKFTNLNVAATGGYNITVFCKDANGVIRNLVIVIKGDVVSARYGDANVRLSNSMAAVSNLGTTVTVRLNALLDMVKECSNTEISNVYNQAVEYGFAIYSTPTDLTNLIVSQFGTLQLDASKNIVKVEKMSAPELEFSLTDSNITFTWNEISASSDVSSQTSYQIHRVDNDGDEAYGPALSGSTTQTYSLSDFNLGQYYTFYVVAQNPYYMDSNNSNKVRIYRLNAINSLKLISGGTYDGQLEYQIASAERDFYDYVLVGETHDTTGKIEIGSKTNVSLKVVGKKNLVSGDVVTSYLDSATTSWSLKEMSTLAPTSQTVTFNNNVISWNEFGAGKGLASQKYVLMFDDGENVATFTTTQTSVSFTAGTDIYDTVAALNEGSLTITVYAFLDTYSVVAGGDIYFAAVSTLANNHQEANFYQYANTATINKLTTPVVSSVEFDYQDDLSKAAEPDIIINFTGNYDSTGDFAIYLNDKHIETASITKLNDVYTYTIPYAEYNNEIAFGTTALIKIHALSETDIPSSMGSVSITRAAKIAGATFEADGRKYKQNLVVTFNSNHTDLTSGGVVAKFTYTANGGTEETEYVLIPVGSASETIQYAMKDFITAHLAVGGKIKAELLTNSYSNDANKIYYLACGEYFESDEFNILNKVTAADITRTAGGFEIDPTINSNKTTYIVKYGANEYTIKYQNEKFEFEFDKTWTDNTYNLIVYAVENGYVESARETIPVTLNRIASVSSVSMTRSSVDLSEVTLSWDEVSGATGYIFRMYNGEGTEIFKDELTGHSYTLTDLFGASYTKIFAYGEISTIIEDLNVRIGISAIGSSASQNNSQEYSFNATIKGNDMVVADFGVDERGIITVDATAGQKYLYRFVDGSSVALSNSVWTLVEADSEQLKIDASFLSENNIIPTGTKFNIELLKVGNITATSTDTNFVLDSSYFTTVGKTLTYEMGTKIKSVTINIRDNASMEMQITNGAYTTIYVGMTADAILSEDTVAPVEIELIGEEGSEEFRISVASLLDTLVTKFNVETYGEKTLYFWDYRETEDAESTYVNFEPYTIDFKYVEDCGFDQVKKFDDNTGTDYKVDLADVAVFFDKVSDDYLSGNIFTFFFVKVSQDGEEIGTYTVDYRNLKSNYYPSANDSYIVTLTELFKEEELEDLYGDLTLDFAVLQIDTSENVRISNWLSETASAIEFTRINSLRRLILSGGNLSWETPSELATNYYVYFAEELSHGAIGDNFVRYDTNQNFFLATDYVGQDGAFYIAVQAVSTDTNCLPSKLIFVTESGGEEPVKVSKNQIKSPLVLSGGKFYFDWDLAGDFLTAFDELSSTDADGAAKFTTKTFHYPFTMTMADLVGDKIRIRFRFTNSSNVTKNFDFNAKDLLLNLFDMDSAYKTKINALAANAGTLASQRVYKAFAELMEKTGTNGVANSSRLFDDIFENLQEGRYSLEYCLVGGDKTLNSYWYEYENQNGDNVIYVGAEPLISAIKVKTATDAINDYKLLIKKSVVYDSSYQQETATNYVMKVYNDVGVSMIFAVTQSAVSLLNGETASTVSVYETNARGEVVANGEYFMFYINHNGANSLLGTFGDEMTKGTYSMQIYTVGNDYTASSKSEYFKLTFYSMGENLSITNGMFTWTTQANRNTTVVYKKHDSLNETVKVLDGSLGSLSFNLEGEGSGLYDYIEFVTVGDVSKNIIAVDSEIYKLNNVYKLQNPLLSNYKGMLTINETASNIEMLDVAFSESPLYTYKIYNKESTESLSTIITNSAQTATYMYTPGATGYTSSDAEYDYRRTEVNANEFYVSSIGSTARFGYEVAAGDEYYVKTVYGLDEDDQLSNKNILISSAYQSFLAKMMDTPTRLSITDGVLTWTGVTGSGDLELSRSSSVIYRIEVTQYKTSYTEGGQTKTTVKETKYFYTAQTRFDFANLNEDELEKDVKYLDVVVRALGLIKAATKPTSIAEEDCVSLVEGGVAYGTLKYKDSSLYILIGEGGTLDTIERSQSVDENSACVVNGHLQWTFSVEGEIDTSDGQWALLSHYKFSVMNARNEEINGQCYVSDTTTIETRIVNGEEVKYTKFTVTFIEDNGQITPGENINLTIYAIELADGKNLIKSYGETISVKKLAAIDTSFVAIDSTADAKIELLNLQKYFTDYAATYSNLEIKTLQYADGEYVLDGRVFNENKYKLYILTADATSPDPRDEHALEDVEIVDEHTTLRLTFQAYSNAENCLYSDISDDIVLQRADWQDSIVWNENLEQFEWDYTGQYSLQTAVVANVVEFDGTDYIDVLDGDTPVTEDLLVGTLYNVVETGDDETIISVTRENETTTYRLSNTYIVNPTFTVTISYGDDTRTYITQTRYFKPTLIGQVTKFAVRVKLGETNIQSNEVLYNDGASVTFDLFASGEGTLLNPYVISNNNQFEKIAYRMTKDSYLNKYTSGNNTVNEEGKYYFTLSDNITLDGFTGVKFHGEFTGILDGSNHVLSYTITDVGDLDNKVTFAAGYLSSEVDEFTVGASLFSNIAASGIVKNLKINASLNKASGYVSQNTTFAGLAITNNGQINNVSLVGFTSNFVGNYSSKMVNMLYSGIVTVNIGGTATIINSSVQNYTDSVSGTNYVVNMVIDNGTKSQRNCISGIASINYATIENCVIGEVDKSTTFKVVGEDSTVESKIAGVSIVNVQNSLIKNCTNNALLTVEPTDITNVDQWRAYFAGIVCHNQGALQDNVNNNYVVHDATELGFSTIRQGEIFINP